MDDFGWLMQRIFGRFIGPSDEDDATDADPASAHSPSQPGPVKPGPVPVAAE
jgi:hypothetical protein